MGGPVREWNTELYLRIRNETCRAKYLEHHLEIKPHVWKRAEARKAPSPQCKKVAQGNCDDTLKPRNEEGCFDRRAIRLACEQGFIDEDQ